MTALVILCGLFAVLWIIRAALFIAGPPVKKIKPRTGLFGYRLFYSDQPGAKTELRSKVLVASSYGLRGKPDAIYRSRSGRLVPAELKSAAIGGEDTPREGDLLQLAAYFLIVEESLGQTPRFGVLTYADAAFKIKNTKALRTRLLRVTDDMRRMAETGEGTAEPGFAKCRNCVCRGTVCEFCEDIVN